MRTLIPPTPLPCSPPAFSSLAVATGNQADSRGSLISVDSNPSNSDRNSEKMDGCEKVRAKEQHLLRYDTSHMVFIFDSEQIRQRQRHLLYVFDIYMHLLQCVSITIHFKFYMDF